MTDPSTQSVVEGFERQVLEGGDRMLRVTRPVVVAESHAYVFSLLEFHNNFTQKTKLLRWPKRSSACVLRLAACKCRNQDLIEVVSLPSHLSTNIPSTSGIHRQML